MLQEGKSGRGAKDVQLGIVAYAVNAASHEGLQAKHAIDLLEKKGHRRSNEQIAEAWVDQAHSLMKEMNNNSR